HFPDRRCGGRPHVLWTRGGPDADGVCGAVRRCRGRPAHRARHSVAFPRAAVGRPDADAAHADRGDPLLLLLESHRPGQTGRAVEGRRHPRRARHLDCQRHPEGPRSARGDPRRHVDPRGARARHARGAGKDRPPPGRRGRDDDDPRGGERGVKAWRGLIEEYRDFLPVSDKTPVVTLFEGNTPLVPAPRLAEATDARMEIYLKCEGFNPTGSFKDRGMTVAISKALEMGSRAVICASTGNTSASAAAFASRAGIRAFVMVPKGSVALGKLSQ